MRDEGWIILLGALFFLPFLGGVHLFDWDEINFAECAREMVETGNYLQVQMDYQPFWEKPPLFFWMQAAAMQVFGVGEYAARFPNAICGIITLLLLYRIGLQQADRRFAWIWVSLYLGSILPHLYFKSGIIDPWFNLFIFAGLYAITRINSGTRRPWVYAVFAGLLLGLAVLTKGPVAVLLVGLTGLVYALWRGFSKLPSLPILLLLAFVTALVPLLWFGIEIVQNGTWFVEEFIRYQYRLFSTPDAGHAGFPGYHVVVLLLGCFPASVLMLGRWRSEKPGQEDFRRWMWILFWVVLLVFSLVKSKIVHYSSLAYFPITYLAAGLLWQYAVNRQPLPRYMRIGLWSVASVWVLALLALPLLLKFRLLQVQNFLSKDPFAQANLSAPVSWSGWEPFPVVFLLAALAGFLLLFKRGDGRATLVLGLGMALFVQTTLFSFIGRVEGYSQRTAVAWYQDLAGKDVYVRPMGFKSYAHLFYTRRMPDYPERGKDLEHLLHGPIDRDAWFVAKTHRPMGLDTLPSIELMAEQNGFSLYRRQAD